MGFSHCHNPLTSITSWFRRSATTLDRSISTTSMSRFFKLTHRNTTFTTELRAGTTTFLTMAYILSVNPAILSSAVGSSLQPDLFVATALTSAIASITMGLLANLPFALAPAMGANTFFAFNLIGLNHSGPLSYPTALALVLTEGAIFMLLSALGLRSHLAHLIPLSIRRASAVGIGFFLASIGLQSKLGLGLIGPGKLELVTLTACKNRVPETGGCVSGKLQSPTFWLGATGFLLITICKSRKMKGSMIYGIVFVTLVSWIRGTAVTLFPYTPFGNERFEYFKKICDFHMIKSTAGLVGFSDLNRLDVWIALATLLYVDILDTTGTVYSLAELGGFVDEFGKFEGEYAAFLVDGGATVVGALLGTSTVTTYVESIAGIEEGGRTGLTSVTVGMWFLVVAVLAPVMTSVPEWAVGAALVAVGWMMVAGTVEGIEWGRSPDAAAAFVTITLMPMTGSIANGIVGGMGVYVAVRVSEKITMVGRWVMLMVVDGHRKKVSVVNNGNTDDGG